MRFFDSCRPQFYFHGARLTKDKVGSRFWKLTLVITCVNEQMVRCDELIQNNYLSIETRDNRVAELLLDASAPGQTMKFFLLADATEPAFETRPLDLGGLRLTRIESLTELWFTCESPWSPALHAFIGDHIYTRMWVEFSPEQLEIVAPAAAQSELPLKGKKKP